ncbi:MAG TPA: DUF3226 domain-containing protein [Sedimentisphaerales bacterium]|nr:DUF3226 domain-containing protein [Sedimentisphaerales bacterium]
MPSPNEAPSPINSKKVIAVEGKDEINFFNALLRHMDITDFDIRDVGGKVQFPNKLPALLKATGFYLADGSSSVTHLAIIRDKDEDEAFKSIATIVTNAGLKPPTKHSEFSNGSPKVGIFIMPGETIDGTMLEDLCLKTVENHKAMTCVNKYASCISALEPIPKNIPKAKVQVFKAQVFLAAQPEIVDSVGLGAQKKYWDFESPALDELKEFLTQLE